MEPKIRSGDLRHSVILQYLNEENISGDVVQTWQTIGTFRAFVRSLSGAEKVIANQLKAVQTHVVTMRYLGTAIPLDPTMRLVWGSVVLGIDSINNESNRNYLYTLYCQQDVDPVTQPGNDGAIFDGPAFNTDSFNA